MWCIVDQSAELKALLSTLVGELIETAHMLPPVIERLAEKEAMDSNRITLKNARDYADVLARLERQHVTHYYNCRNRWERLEVRRAVLCAPQVTEAVARRCVFLLSPRLSLRQVPSSSPSHRVVALVIATGDLESASTPAGAHDV